MRLINRVGRAISSGGRVDDRVRSGRPSSLAGGCETMRIAIWASRISVLVIVWIAAMWILANIH